ncbi:hypothetical protein Ancab_035672 [Ancistrocladus abbreviatus]
MAAPASSSLSLSSIFSLLSVSPAKSQFLPHQIPFPLSSPSLSLQSPKGRNGLITLMGTYNVQVVVDENEPEERLLNRFRREVMKAGVILECKRRRFFENKHDKKKRKSREAAKRNRKRRPQSRSPRPDKEDTKKEEYEFDNDNWDLPDGNLPY